MRSLAITLTLLFLFIRPHPYLIPLDDEDIYMKYSGFFDLYTPLYGVYNGEPLEPEILDATYFVKGELLVRLDKNYIDYAIYTMEIRFKRSYEAFEILGLGTSFSVSVKVYRDGGMIDFLGHRIPFLFVADLDYLSSGPQEIQISINGTTNISISLLEPVDTGEEVVLKGTYSVQTFGLDNGHKYLASISVGDETILATYSYRGYARFYNFLVTPLLRMGIVITFNGNLVETNLEGVQKQPSLLEMYRNMLIELFGPYWYPLYYASMMMAIGLVAAFAYWLVRRLR